MMRVLDIGPIDQLRAGTYETKAMAPAEKDKLARQVKNMANPDLTLPSIVFVAHSKGMEQAVTATPPVEPAVATPTNPTPKT